MESTLEMTENKQIKQRKGISGSTIKIIAMVAMLIDHIAAIVLDSFITKVMPPEASYDVNVAMKFLSEYGAIYYADMLMRIIGRFGFPVFVFLLVEGFKYTRNIKKYIRNLAIFALVSEIPFNLALTGKMFSFDYQNVFFTLLIGVLTLTGIKAASQKDWSKKLVPLYYVAAAFLGGLFGYLIHSCELSQIIAYYAKGADTIYFIAGGAVMTLVILIVKGMFLTAEQKNAFTFSVPVIIVGVLLADLLKTDYSGWGVFTIVVMYYFRNSSYVKRMGMGALALTIMQSIEISSLLMMIPAAFYNGKRGLNLKYVFYVFYPAHILILYLITLLLGYTTFSIF